MLLKKLSNNEHESGHSALNFVMTIVIVILLCCAFLDLIHLIRIKSVVARQANIYAAACIQQGGFKRSVPKDWQQTFGENCTNYMTTGEVSSSFKSAISKLAIVKNSGKVKLKINGMEHNLGSTTGDAVLPFQEKGTLFCLVKYRFNYLRAFGILDEEYECFSSHEVTGFWVHKNTQL